MAYDRTLGGGPTGVAGRSPTAAASIWQLGRVAWCVAHWLLWACLPSPETFWLEIGLPEVGHTQSYHHQLLLGATEAPGLPQLPGERGAPGGGEDPLGAHRIGSRVVLGPALATTH